MNDEQDGLFRWQNDLEEGDRVQVRSGGYAEQCGTVTYARRAQYLLLDVAVRFDGDSWDTTLIPEKLRPTPEEGI